METGSRRRSGDRSRSGEPRLSRPVPSQQRHRNGQHHECQSRERPHEEAHEHDECHACGHEISVASQVLLHRGSPASTSEPVDFESRQLLVDLGCHRTAYVRSCDTTTTRTRRPSPLPTLPPLASACSAEWCHQHALCERHAFLAMREGEGLLLRETARWQRPIRNTPTAQLTVSATIA